MKARDFKVLLDTQLEKTTSHSAFTVFPIYKTAI